MSQITTHVLDTARGCPASGIPVTLYREHGHAHERLAEGSTDSDGRIADLLPEGGRLDAGTYRLHFAVADYLAQHAGDAFYPAVDVSFRLAGTGEHYHVPLLLSPFGYSTYRGS
jgi:5-hydroxyisourate hydrolase